MKSVIKVKITLHMIKIKYCHYDEARAYLCLCIRGKSSLFL